MKVFSFLLLFSFLICLEGCSDSNVLLIKRSYFEGNNYATIGTLLSSFIDKPTWSIRKTNDEKTFVIFSGRVSPKLHQRLYNQLVSQVSERELGELQSMGCQKAFRISTNLLNYEQIYFNEESLSMLTDECLRLCIQRYSPEALEVQRQEILNKILNFAYEKVDKVFVPVGNRVFLKWEISKDQDSFKLKNFWLDTFKGSAQDFIEALNER